MIALANVLVATDFGEEARIALAYGRDLARTFGATLHVLHVVEEAASQMPGGEATLTNFIALEREIAAAARQQLDALVDEDDRNTLRARSLVTIASNAARAIVDYAQDNAIDLIVIGTHGRGRVAQLIMGSVAERVVRTAPCSVLTVHHRQREFLAPDALQVVKHA